ncbi:MAG: tyrosine-type recombinase/integrase, partial [Acetatifactor sp.]
KQHRDKISQNYKSTLYRYFSAFWGWAYDNEHIKSNIMSKVPHVKAMQKKKERLLDEEIEDIRDACQTLKEKALVELLLSTGMRVGEVSALNLSDLDLQHKRVSIYGEKTNRYRTGMLTTKAVKALRKYIASREYCTDALFIADRKPYGRMQNSSIEKMVKDIAVRAGITRISVTVHVYRKTFASIMYKKTKDVLLVSKLLGHAKTDMTVQYYLIDDIDDMQYRYNVAQG